MNDYLARVNTPVPCGNCGGCVAESLEFQWGRVPCEYKLGDPLRWNKHHSGYPLPAFVSVDKGRTYNIGDPDALHVALVDETLFNAEYENYCKYCSVRIWAAFVRIEAGVVSEVWSECGTAPRFPLMLGTVAISVFYLSESRVVPRIEWNDGPIVVCPKESVSGFAVSIEDA